MNIWRLFSILAAILFLAGCQSEPEVVISPSTLRLTQAPAANRTPQRNTSAGTLANVRQPETVKAYGVNRYVDPADPSIMHERHASTVCGWA